LPCAYTLYRLISKFARYVSVSKYWLWRGKKFDIFHVSIQWNYQVQCTLLLILRSDIISLPGFSLETAIALLWKIKLHICTDVNFLHQLMKHVYLHFPNLKKNNDRPGKKLKTSSVIRKITMLLSFCRTQEHQMLLRRPSDRNH